MKQKNHSEVQVEEEYCWSRTLTQSLELSNVLYQPVVIFFHSECLFDTFIITGNSSAYTDAIFSPKNVT